MTPFLPFFASVVTALFLDSQGSGDEGLDLESCPAPLFVRSRPGSSWVRQGLPRAELGLSPEYGAMAEQNLAFERARGVQERLSERFLGKQGVVYIGIGGEHGGPYDIDIGVLDLERAPSFPKQIDGVRLHVRLTGQPRAEGEAFGSWMFPFDFRPLTPAEIEKQNREREARLATAVPFSPDMKWEPHLVLQASSWPAYDLFPEVEVLPRGATDTHVKALVRGLLGPEEEKYVSRSKTGRFVYMKRVLPRGEVTSNGQGQREGTVRFDGDVVIPIVWERRVLLDDDGQMMVDAEGQPAWRSGDPILWMSHTPHETMTLREGVKWSKGHVVVGGLGLGWQLAQILNRKQVTKVTLLERSQELVDWLLPRLLTSVPADKLEVKIGDAKRILPTLQADIAVMDIWPTYTDIAMSMAKMEGCSPGIGRFWGWGYGWKGQKYVEYVSKYRSGRWKSD